MVNDLPLLNDCGYCEKLKWRYCLNFSVNCSMCIRERCKNCFSFNKFRLIVEINTVLILFKICF